MDARGLYMESDFSPEKRHSDQKPENFTVEDLLDFSNEDDVMTDAFYDMSIIAGNSNESSTVVTPLDSCNSSVSGNDINFPSGNFSDSHFSADICVPYEDMLHLEWLSNFVEEDNNNYSTEEQYHFQNPHLIPDSSKPPIILTQTQAHIHPNYPTHKPENISPQVPAKAQRSKRSRAAPANWSSRLLHLITPSSSNSSSQTMTSSSDDSKPKTATFYKRRETNLENTEGRRCLHCQSEKTPQWRTGPMGPKTLCNACGVRFKSGRLVPEYRPAASPTFVSTKHSNSHRKVLELRRQREMHGGVGVAPHHHNHSHSHNQNHHGAFIGQQHGMFGVSDGGDFMIQHCNGIDYRHLM